MSDDEIHRIIAMEVVVTVKEVVPEVFGSIKTVMIEMFDERYATVTQVVAIVARSYKVIRCSIGS